VQTSNPNLDPVCYQKDEPANEGLSNMLCPKLQVIRGLEGKMGKEKYISTGYIHGHI
jgi:hypothetical protein